MSNNNINNDISLQFAKIKKNIEQATQNAFEKCVLDIAEKSIKICPFRTGELRESIKVEINNAEVAKGQKNGTLSKKASVSNANNFNNLNANITYNSPHATCHEWDDETTNWTTPNTHSKFLENPAFEYDYKNNFALEFSKRLNKK